MTKATSSSYTSKPSGKDTMTAGVQAMADAPTRDLKRSSPEAGVYQSGNNARGGTLTRNCDSGTDGACTYEAPGLAALRKAQDARTPHGAEGR